MLRQFPAGQVMTQDEFMQSAMDKPLSPWRTFLQSAQEGALISPGLGTMIREGQAPDIAKVPVAGGRGGVMWRYESPAEVEARGDKLFQAEDDYKAAPEYRPDIPFEKGMTQSRARALADMYDISQVRQFYGSKRPVAAFLGTIAGSAVDPINYIPIAGEAAATASVARLGRIFGRALVGGADAAANAALFSVLTADQRAKFGDDVSWQAVTTNAAYAALAGSIIGGAFGAGSKFLGWEHGIEPPKVEAAPRPDLPPAMSMAGIAEARFAPVRPVTVSDVVTRLETAANRIRAADVMNDAVHGMINDAEVRLGERSRDNIAAISLDLARVTEDSQPKGFLVASGKVFAHEGQPFPNGRPSTIWKPEAEGARLFRTKAEAQRFIQGMRKASGDSTEGTIIPAKDVRRPAAEIKAGDVRTQIATGPSPGAAARTNFSVPPPDTSPIGLRPAYEKVEVRAKPQANPDQASIDRMVSDAKEEGFDPETGSHDLEPDVQALREQGVISEAEEAALKAADETYKAVTAWEKVMDIARSCVLS